MKIHHNPSDKIRDERIAKELPPLQEQVDALMEGGQKLAEIKRRIGEVKRKYRLD